MPTDAKRQAVAELAEMLGGSAALVVADYRGLRVADIQAVRRALGANGVEFHVVKNSLMSIAADDAGRSELKPFLAGPTALATTPGDAVALAKSVLDALRPYSRVVTLRGGLLGERAIDADGLQRLSTLASREVLLGRVAGGMAAPMSRMATVLAAPIASLGRVLAAVAEQKSSAGGTATESGGTPAGS